jgi:hypothetical protein
MIESLVAIGTFLLQHADLVSAIKDAIDGGASKQELMKAIERAMVAASDAQMKKELG